MPILPTMALTYNVDIVMCIDATGSMSPILNEVKTNAVNFYKKFVDAMNKKSKKCNQVRIKVIAFRDYSVDSMPMAVSDFFVIGGGQINQTAQFSEFVNKIEAGGGGDTPENGLEALSLAIDSNWVRTGNVRRHVIMMFTDAEAIDLGSDRENVNYPSNMPNSIAKLREKWESQTMEPRAKRMLLFAPDCFPWNNMIDWSNTFHQASAAGKGCSESDIETCIHLLVQSI
ncbi:MAG: VWA domain-containing protein [Clostridia bacterium]|nr:VWA domain-containing protein [Clostridia bacterium]